MNKILIFHPVLFGFAFILLLFAHNQGQLLPSNIILPLLLTFSGIGIVFSLCLFIVRNVGKAALLTSIALFFFFLYGQAYALFDSVSFGGVLIGRFRYFFPLWVSVFTIPAYYVMRAGRALTAMTQSAMIAAAVLLVFPVADISLFALNNYAPETVPAQTAGGTATAGDAATQPDIYYIILDGYANSETLKTIFDYDNAEFLNGLRALGFTVRDESRSNYARTFLSLSSSLNMRYLDEFTALGDEELQFRSTYRLIRDNEAIRFLRDRGYSIVHFRSGWDQTEFNSFADANIACGTLNEFLTLVIRATPLDVLDKKFHFTGEDARMRTLCTFSRLTELVETSGPKFVFAHVLQPHAPYVFGPHGEEVREDDPVLFGDGVDDKKPYLGQLQHLNTLVLKTVTAMTARSGRPSIIILQSDHGTASLAGLDGEQPEDLTEAFFKERMRNFMAIYVSSSDHPLAYFATPVNLFRAIFDAYFDADYEFLDERSFYSPPYASFLFMDVTDSAR